MRGTGVAWVEGGGEHDEEVRNSCNRTAGNVNRGSRRQQLHEGAPLITIIDMDDTTQSLCARTHAPVRDMNHFVQDSAPHSWGQVAACVSPRPQQAQQPPASEFKGKRDGFQKGDSTQHEGGRGSHLQQTPRLACRPRRRCTSRPGVGSCWRQTRPSPRDHRCHCACAAETYTHSRAQGR